MDAPLRASLATATPTTFTAVEIVLPGETVRLCSGGFVVIAGQTYEAEHPVYGALSLPIETVEDGADGQASRCTLTLLPPSDVAIVALAAPTTQGSSVTVWQGTVNPETGAVIGVEVLFLGEFDTPHLNVDENGWVLTIECGTEEGRLLEPNEERRLNDSFHQSVWPGERGLEHVTNVQKKDFWRADDPSTSGVVGRGGLVSSALRGSAAR